MKRDGNQTADDLLRGDRKWSLALPLAEIELCHRWDDDLNHAVGDLAGNQLIEPDPVETGVLMAHLLEDALPNRRVKSRFGGATSWRLAL